MLEVDVRRQLAGFKLDVSLRFDVGVTAILGPSGAGKSTLLRLISGLDRPDEGSIRLGNQVWFDSEQNKELDVRHRQVGMMFQHPRLLNHMDVLSNVELGVRDEQSYEDVVKLTGVEPLILRPVASLSGGEKQRVMLARALAGKPKVLLLDEPFTGLDQVSRRELLNRLARVLPTVKIPILFVTHAFDEAARLARHFVHLSAGQVISSGSAEEVLGGIAPGVDIERAGERGPDLPVDAHEAATSSLISGEVVALEASGLARIKVGGQSVDAPAGNFSVGDRVYLRLWARDVVLSPLPGRQLSARNSLAGRIETLEQLNNGQVMVRIAVEGEAISALVMAQTVKDLRLEQGKPVFVIFKSTALDLSMVVEDAVARKTSKSKPKEVSDETSADQVIE
ncbi:MAG: ATP-binding cassette domain-containing protein [Hyphomicrobiaceae bacterium]|nr:ATP-binding cassette domain-containing protein [Hyphomicrobiaceae bacterium]MCC0024077.1 ATP-binding cassette domain-containing protein [Hyphomicrobiaceae bacterium]